MTSSDPSRRAKNRIAYDLLCVAAPQQPAYFRMSHLIFQHSLEFQNDIGFWSTVSLACERYVRASLTPTSTAFATLAKGLLRQLPGPDCEQGCRALCIEELSRFEGRFLTPKEANFVWGTVAAGALSGLQFLLRQQAALSTQCTIHAMSPPESSGRVPRIPREGTRRFHMGPIDPSEETHSVQNMGPSRL